MKILVTGSNGQVGYCLRRKLAVDSFDFLCLDRNALDITDKTAVVEAINKCRPNIVMNAAAYTAVDKAETDETMAFNVNADGAGYLAEAASDIGAAIFHISTDYVFSGDKQGAYKEEDEANPINVYGESKLAGEKLVAKLNPRHIILRTSWVFCEHGNNFVKTMLKVGKEKSVLNIVSDQIGGPTYAGDIANVLIDLCRCFETHGTLPWGTYNYSGKPDVSWLLFAKEIFDSARKNKRWVGAIPKLAPISTKDYGARAQRPHNSKLDPGKLFDSFGIRPSDWKAALNDVESYLID